MGYMYSDSAFVACNSVLILESVLLVASYVLLSVTGILSFNEGPACK